ncbi:MAG: hypothetical protein IPJ81_03615 [Chitinophagaceae bacterium]|nr:hypothetical protein [Chitinophagaceae bacterium]
MNNYWRLLFYSQLNYFLQAIIIEEINKLLHELHASLKEEKPLDDEAPLFNPEEIINKYVEGKI